jgi:hypothetical protein
MLLRKMWRRAAAYALFLAVGVALTLAAVHLVLDLTHRIPDGVGPVLRSLAISGALLGSVAVLFLATYISVRVAVALFDGQSEVRK